MSSVVLSMNEAKRIEQILSSVCMDRKEDEPRLLLAIIRQRTRESEEFGSQIPKTPDNIPYAFMPMGTAEQLRDWFAGMAPDYPFSKPNISLQDELDPVTKLSRAFAEWAYAFADAMMAEREKK